LFGFGKGKIGIALEKYNFSPGETMRGTVSLELKKPVQARQLRAVFYGTRKKLVVDRSRPRRSGVGIRVGGSPGVSMGGASTRTETETVYRFEMQLDGEKEYSGGQYQLEIGIPSDLMQSVKAPDGTLGNIVKAAKFLAGPMARVQWFIEVTLDIPKGSDVGKKVQVNLV